VEKQKLRFSYGISEKQTRRYVTRAQKIKGPTGAILLQILEIRLDNIVYRLGLAKTVPSARQWINHKHILVDKKCVRAPGFSCTPGQVITVKATKNIRRLLEQNLEARTLSVPSHLSLDLIRISGIVSGKIVRRELHFDLKELLVLEYYSNRL
jgi:small subunit ribosomal protein S4